MKAQKRLRAFIKRCDQERVFIFESIYKPPNKEKR